MKRLSFCITCMGRLHHLRQTLPRNLEWTAHLPEVEFVLLNFSSPDALEDWAKAELNDAIRQGRLNYFRADGFTHFRMAHAKNVAHRLAQGEIVCNLDADNFLGAGFAEFLMETFTAGERVYVRSPISKGTHGRIAFRKSDFEALGGYDERMNQGWGFEDQDMIRRAQRFGLREVRIPKDRNFLRALDHSHDERTVLSAQRWRSDSNRAHKKVARENEALGCIVANQGSGWGVAPLAKNFLPAAPRADESEKLHVGCGRHRLPGWMNHDRHLDIRRTLPFGDESLKFILAEHVVEHVTPAEAWHFFKEARRVLKAGGALRIAVPCVDLIAARHDEDYAAFLRRKIGGDGSVEDAMQSIILNWGHPAIWTTGALSAVLGTLGFGVKLVSPGISQFAERAGVDGHAGSIGHHANWVESGVVEAAKP